MVAAVIIAALAYANRGPIRMYIKVNKGEMESWAPQPEIVS